MIFVFSFRSRCTTGKAEVSRDIKYETRVDEGNSRIGVKSITFHEVFFLTKFRVFFSLVRSVSTNDRREMHSATKARSLSFENFLISI